MEGFGFWIFMGLLLAAIIVTGSRERIEKQRTLQRMLERNEEINEALVNRLLGKPDPGSAYRALRAIGAFIMLAAIPIGVVAAMLVVTEDAPMSGVVASGSFFFLLPFLVGLGLFLASRFCERPEQD